MEYRGVDLRVSQADVLSFSSDVLALKYAQASYGVDRQAIRRAGIDPVTLPGVGKSLLVPRPAGLASRNLLFLGVKDISDFKYGSIRDFSRRALAQARKELPSARKIAMTLHGAGFGLDEIEAFESEIAGIVEALDAGDHPADLESVVIVERNARRADRMDRALAALLRPGSEDNRIGGAGPQEHRRRVDSAGSDSAKRRHAFVAMPFAESFDDVFYYGISQPVRAAGLLCERIDQDIFTGDILTRMKERIATSAVLIADLSDANPNVYLEVGYAWGTGVPCILLCNRTTRLKFDVQGHRCLFYGNIKELEKSLTTELGGLSAA